MQNFVATFFSVLIVSFVSLNTFASEMTQQRLHQLLGEQVKNVEVNGNRVSFDYNQSEMLCISDENANRMRIISPIALVSDVPVDALLIAMAANFHSALDARYAIGDGTVYAAYIHPLSSLTEEQLISAIQQVANAKANFGTSYSSGELVFPSQESQHSEELNNSQPSSL